MVLYSLLRVLRCVRIAGEGVAIDMCVTLEETARPPLHAQHGVPQVKFFNVPWSCIVFLEFLNVSKMLFGQPGHDVIKLH